MLQIDSIMVYPLKSGQGLSLREGELTSNGLKWDRHWMVVDSEGKLISQREEPRLALVKVKKEEDSFQFIFPEGENLEIIPGEGGDTRTVLVHKDQIEARDCGEKAASILSEFLGQSCRLVASSKKRQKEKSGLHWSLDFADICPLLVLSLSSLQDLNSRLDRELSWLRFRPNLVLSGGEPYFEDREHTLHVGEVELKPLQGCSRCSLTTVDPRRGIKTGPEPLKTLAQYRKREGKVYFGHYYAVTKAGKIRIGQKVLENPTV